MSREELLASVIGLAALVQHEAANIQGDIVQYGSRMWDPNTPAVKALEERLRELNAFKVDVVASTEP